MSEDASSCCPACTAVLFPGTVECPWCGHLMSPEAEESPAEAVLGAQAEEESAPTSAEPARDEQPDTPVHFTQEPGLSELPPASSRASAISLKVLGIVLAVFSLLALVYFFFQVASGRLPRVVLALPVFGMMIGLISVAVGQRR